MRDPRSIAPVRPASRRTTYGSAILSTLGLATVAVLAGAASEPAPGPFAVGKAAPAVAWARQYGGPGPEVPFALAADASGSVWVAGTFGGQADFDSRAGTPGTALRGQPVFVVASDGAGELTWARGLGSPAGAEPRALAAGAAGAVALAGYFIDAMDLPGELPTLRSAGSADAFLVELDAKGKAVRGRGLGGEHADLGAALDRDAEGRLYLAGSFQRSLDLGGDAGRLASAGLSDAFLLVLDAEGRPAWSLRVGGEHRDRGLAVAADGQGGAYLAGTFERRLTVTAGAVAVTLESAGRSDLFLLHAGADGALRWVRRLGGLGVEQVAGLGVDAAGNVTLAGSFQGELSFGDGEGGLAAAGIYDLFAVRWDATGRPLWARRVGGRSTTYAQGLAVAPSGELYIAGYFQGRVDFDPGPGSAELATEAPGNADAFVLALDAAGGLRWARRIGGSGLEHGFGVALAPDGGLYLSGLFNRRVDFGPGAPSLESRGKTDVFLARLAPAG